MKQIDGARIAQKVHEESKKRIRSPCPGGGLRPGLAAILVGDDPASRA
jgi:5,10-methylene-tetrahydrofolate dehydrogenase/methenyl tetrahydrofolate cyclohydrolase